MLTPPPSLDTLCLSGKRENVPRPFVFSTVFCERHANGIHSKQRAISGGSLTCWLMFSGVVTFVLGQKVPRSVSASLKQCVTSGARQALRPPGRTQEDDREQKASTNHESPLPTDFVRKDAWPYCQRVLIPTARVKCLAGQSYECSS